MANILKRNYNIKELLFSIYDKDRIDKITVSGRSISIKGDLAVLPGVTSLKLPEGYVISKVEGTFKCWKSDIESLEGSPKFVTDLVQVEYSKIKSLRGATSKSDNFIFDYNPYIENLIGCPQKTIHLYFTGCSKLKSLEGAPRTCESLSIIDCPIENLKGCPEARVSLKVFACSLKSLEGCPQNTIDYRFEETKISSLKGLPRVIKGDLKIPNNKNLTSLEYAPESVGGDFDCSDNKLKSLDGKPKVIGGVFKY